MNSLFAKEIQERQEIIHGAIERATTELNDKQLQIQNLFKAKETLKKQFECNEAGTHEFECDNKSYFGARFDEVCKYCGFINSV